MENRVVRRRIWQVEAMGHRLITMGNELLECAEVMKGTISLPSHESLASPDASQSLPRAHQLR